MASSSSVNYEVFLSFCGQDVRFNFADHLYNALVDAGIKTFRDEEELPKGNQIGPELLTAIKESRISIPILSENYASRKWCLNELTEISECRRTRGQLVLPIFYKVEPTDVRNQRRKYEEAFEEHLQKGFHETDVQNWKKALKEVGELKGWHVEGDMYEGKLIKEVVTRVLSELNKRRSNISNNNLVGIQSHIEEMLKLLDIESDDRTIVGIHGLGGIGKTTIARAVYNEVFNHFEGCCSFIPNVRESAHQYKGLVHLQKQLVSNILKKENEVFDSEEDGIDVIEQRFRAKKVLIVLDDVDRDDQVKSLVGDLEWFGVGSKIIITSRDEQMSCVQEATKIYKPKVMDSGESLQLFSRHAFKKSQPPQDHLDLSKAIVKTTGGLPLALQVIGSSLFKKKKLVWEGMLTKLQKIPNDDVMKRLKISYDGLEDAEQQMFLDTACFFIGKEKDIACHIWEGCNFFPKVGLDVLCAKSLVTISEYGTLGMHDVLRDLGREIVRQENKDDPGKRSRLWFQEEVLVVINSEKGTSNVKGLIIDFRHISMSQCLMTKGFSAMTGLRLLQVDYALTSENFTNSFSELRWLSWKGCPGQYELTNFCPQKLVVLDLSHSKITNNWMGWNCIKKATNLKVLNLSFCRQLSSTPDFSANQLLEVLILNSCINLEEIDPSICCLTKLVILDMGGCMTVKGLPSEISQLTSLQKLNLKTWKSLVELPEKLDGMISLTELDLSHCNSLLNLPSEICQLTSLKRLNLGGCSSLSFTSLDFSSCSTSSLTELNVRGCTSILYISGLPSSLIELDAGFCRSMEKLSSTSGGLINLKRLCLYNCSYLEEIEGVDEKLDSLEDLDIGFCYLLKKLPKLVGSKTLTSLSFSQNHSISDFEGEGMYSLEKLLIWNCKELRKIPYLRDSKRLKILEICDCPELSEIEGLENYESLQRLSIVMATSLKKLPEDISTGLKNLSYLRISGCFSMERLPDLSNFKELRELFIGFCGNWKDCNRGRHYDEIEDWESFTEIPGLDKLESLRELGIARCISIHRLPELSNLNNLTSLYISDCENLTGEIHGIDILENLWNFVISGCESLKRLSDLSNLKNLRNLTIEGCKNLTEIHGFDRLKFLERLGITGCESLERLPDLSNLKNLTVLSTNGCKKLTKIQATEASNGLEFVRYFDVRWYINARNGLEFLRALDVRECISLERLPDLSNFKYLMTLLAYDCKKLIEIQARNGLESLRTLCVSGCISLERLPDLTNSNYLTMLSANGCKKLTEIQARNELNSLRDLDVSGCESLERLPDMSNFKRLWVLSANGCKKLTEIQASMGLESLRKLDVRGCTALEKLPDLMKLKKSGNELILLE
ncbi:disease resistance protein RPV1-like [Macadamia integrifolia]|uniref:disease resistance protein RPV1-like n=1 Tax=Macadamia integrifolia TaxID=60698 RepID=UPI001C52F0B3|nr:disease resistance protein RPV1-like [Macadamia integrifolia]XP_042479500.1 disease resistance protein RPV1-like [Macadamia integrifolia]XP_042479501.1 disease resistance protein RPV1-like [Macadamia integrifolia]XP_042479502.1 disease resistance protein RPV1-like [Macadamia integrifolia]XP_042479503.1 disease resistance protein RPV1-like [Macadamia integrifolia]XP_042479505.1 disease resistance protein RPV1-like [Macadamia integrifolia]